MGRNDHLCFVEIEAGFAAVGEDDPTIFERQLDQAPCGLVSVGPPFERGDRRTSDTSGGGQRVLIEF